MEKLLEETGAKSLCALLDLLNTMADTRPIQWGVLMDWNYQIIALRNVCVLFHPAHNMLLFGCPEDVEMEKEYTFNINDNFSISFNIRFYNT